MDSGHMNYNMAVGSVRGGAQRIRRVIWDEATHVAVAVADDPSTAALILVTNGVESDYAPTDDDKSGSDWICF